MSPDPAPPDVTPPADQATSAGEFDERPAALLGYELRYDYFKNLLTTAITLIGGAVVLKGALVPEAPFKTNFLMGLGMLALGGLSAFEGQNLVLKRLESRHDSKNVYSRFIEVSAAGFLFFGLGLVLSYFMTSFK